MRRGRDPCGEEVLHHIAAQQVPGFGVWRRSLCRRYDQGSRLGNKWLHATWKLDLHVCWIIKHMYIQPEKVVLTTMTWEMQQMNSKSLYHHHYFAFCIFFVSSSPFCIFNFGGRRQWIPCLPRATKCLLSDICICTAKFDVCTIPFVFSTLEHRTLDIKHLTLNVEHSLVKMQM